MKIAVYTMAKNEAEHVARFCETTRGADVVVVTDTGSSDGTLQLLRQGGVEVSTARIVPWRFDIATNVALSQVPSDIDICVKLDLDEVFSTPPGVTWREAIESAWEQRTTQLQYLYTWNWQRPGVPGVQFYARHIHARSGYVWQHPGHAALCCTRKDGATSTAKLLQIHHHMVPKGRPDYLPLLELAVEENECPRTLFYLGREYFMRKMYDQAINTLTKYLEHRKANWKAERADAMRMIGDSLTAQQQFTFALPWLLRATTEYPTAREPWYAVMQHMMTTRDWDGAVWAGKRCLAILHRDPAFVTQSAAAWGPMPYTLLATAYLELANTDAAVGIIERGLGIFPEDKTLETLALSTNLFEAAT